MNPAADNHNLIRFGGVASILTGIGYLGTSISLAFMPTVMQTGAVPHEFWTAMVQQPGIHLLWHWSQVFTGIIGLAAVPAIATLIKDQHQGWARWVNILAYLGFAVLARGHLMEIAFDRKVLRHYADADPAYQEAVHMVAGLALDKPEGVLTLGGIGLWVLVVSVLGRRSGQLSKALWGTGATLGIAFIAGTLGFAFLYQPLVIAYFIVGAIILAPLWHLWIGMHLIRSAHKA